MIIPLLGVSSLSELFESDRSVTVPRPTVCPRCEARDTFWQHDSFKRWAIEGELRVQIKVPRFLCHDCGLTISCLLVFLIPYRQFTAPVVAVVVENYSTKKTSYRKEADAVVVLDSEDTPSPSHNQIFRWVDCLARKSAHLLLQIQKELVMRGSAKELEDSASGSCPNALKAHTLLKATALNHSLELVQLAGMLLIKDSLSTLHAHFLSEVESLQEIFSGRALRLTAPQNVGQVVF